MKSEYWIAFFVYFSMVFAIGIFFRKRHSSSADMFVGGRKLNFWVTALSAQASDMSSWLFMAFPTYLFLGGLPQIWMAIALIVGMYCNWQFIAKKLRTQTEKLDSYTLPTFFAKRYNDKTGTIRVLSASLLLFFITYYLAASLISMGLIFESVFEMDYLVGVLVATSVMIAYIFIGGYVSVAWTDLFQAIFLLGAIIIVPCVAFFHIEGIQEIFSVAKATNVPMTLFASKPGSTPYDVLLIFLSWGLGYFGMPHIISKFMGIKNPDDLTKSKYLGIAWQALALSAAAIVGLIGIAYFQQGLEKPELLFVTMVKDLFHPLAGGFILCGIIAATISTMDSQILVAASALTEDIYKQLVRKNAKSKEEVFVFRLSVLFVSAVAIWISLARNTTIMDTVFYAWSGLGSSFGPLVIVSLYSKRVTLIGAISGMLTGGIIAASWPTINAWLAAQDLIGPIPSMIPGFLFGTVAIFLVSYCTKKQLSTDISPKMS